MDAVLHTEPQDDREAYQSEGVKIMADDRKDRIAYGKQLHGKGVRSIAELQKAVKAKFGKGIAFRDLTSVFPQKPGGKKKTRGRPPKPGGKKKTRGRPPTRGAKKTGRRGRPRGATAAGQWLLVAGDEVERHGGIRNLQSRVAELLAEGYTQDDISIYEKTSMDMTIRTTVTL
jgi:hypothetical protein